VTNHNGKHAVRNTFHTQQHKKLAPLAIKVTNTSVTLQGLLLQRRGIFNNDNCKITSESEGEKLKKNLHLVKITGKSIVISFYSYQSMAYYSTSLYSCAAVCWVYRQCQNRVLVFFFWGGGAISNPTMSMYATCIFSKFLVTAGSKFYRVWSPTSFSRHAFPVAQLIMLKTEKS